MEDPLPPAGATGRALRDWAARSRRKLPLLQRWLLRTPGAQRQLAALIVLVTILGIELSSQLGVRLDAPTPVLFFAVVVSSYVAGVTHSLLALALALSYCAYHLIGTGPAVQPGAGVALLSLAVLAPSTAHVLHAWTHNAHGGSLRRARSILRRAADMGEQRYTEFVNGLEALVWEVDPATEKVSFVNAYAEELLGYAHERWRTDPGLHEQVIHPEDREAVLAARRAVLREGRARQIEYRLVARDGYSIWVRDSIAVLPGGAAGARRLRGVAINISDRKRMEDDLHVEKERFRSLFEGVPVGLYRTTPQGKFIVANGALVRMMGYHTHEALYASAANEIYTDPLDRWRWQDAVIHTGGVRNFELPYRRRDGKIIWVRNTVKAERDAEGEVAYYEGVLEDITDRKLAEAAERAAQAKFRGLVEQSLVGIYIVQDEKLVYANPKMSEIFGYPQDQLLSLPSVLELAAEEHRRKFRDYIQRPPAEQGGEPFSFRGRRRDGSLVEIEVHSSRTEFGDSEAVIATMLDITTRKRAEERLHHLAFHDTLTGLPNRMLFMERLEHALARSQRGGLFAVLFLDLNRFKVVNDSLGHPTGDELLRVVARRLQRCIRPGDTVARFGGDEFAVLLDDIGEVDEATRIAELIQGEISTPVELNGYTLYTSASVGIALSSDGHERAEHVLRSADMAMYRAKASGASRYEVFDRRMHADALVRLQLETDLQRAVERRQFRLHYQPIVCLRTGQLAGFEALVRWQHHERGLISPGTFIPLAEELGLIVPMGRWVLRTACEQLREWRTHFPDHPSLSVSVNVSAKQFLQSSIVDDVEETIRETEVAPGCLKLEITESVLLEDQNSAAETISRLKALGVRIHLDDFGTGYSNLGYLHHLPLDALKIDRSFVAHLEAQGNRRHLVSTIVSLARNLGADIVAEGIETEEQAAELRRLGCGYGQGYLFSPGRSAGELEGMIGGARPFRLPGPAPSPLTLERTG